MEGEVLSFLLSEKALWIILWRHLRSQTERDVEERSDFEVTLVAGDF